MRRSNLLLERFENQMGLNEKSKKCWFWCAFILLFVYLECVVFAQNICNGTASLLLSIFYAVIVVPLCFAGVILCSKFQLSVSDESTRRNTDKKKTVLFVIGVFVATFLIFFLWQIAFWPGSFSVDSINQYSQIVRGSYSDWHPVLHTWIFFWIPFQVFHGPAGIVLTQIIWFSLAVSYLLFVLYINGYSKRVLILSWLYIVLNPNTTCMAIYPVKDSAFGIFSLVLFTQLINIYKTDGLWLKKWYNVTAFSIIAFLAMGMRHNASLLVVPIFIILFVFMKKARRSLIVSISSVIIATVLLKGPIFAMFSVEKPGLRQTELLGMPMTILSDIYVEDREALNEDARRFMDSLTTQEEWEKYSTSNFNSIKWSSWYLCDNVEAEGAIPILKYTIDASLKRPKIALKAFVNLTKLVWKFDSGAGGDVWIGVNPDANKLGIYYHGNERLKSVLLDYASNGGIYVTKYLFSFIGVIILLLLFVSVSNLFKSSISRVFIALPLMIYNFGAMLLLSDPTDFRFFYFNFLIIVPILCIILAKKSEVNHSNDSLPGHRTP